MRGDRSSASGRSDPLTQHYTNGRNRREPEALELPARFPLSAFQPFAEAIEPRHSAHPGRWMAAWVNPKPRIWWGSPLRDSRLLFAQERRTRRQLLPQGYQILERKLRRAETGS